MPGDVAESGSSVAGGRRWAPYLFIAPFLLLFALFLGVPLVQSVYLMLTRGGGSHGLTLRNLVFLLHDPLFWLSALNTSLYTAVLLAVQIPLALGLAILLHSPKVRSRRVLRLLFFSPFLVGNVFAAVLFALLLDARHGLLNSALSLLRRAPVEIAWLDDPRLVMVSVLLVSVWLTTGFAMLCFLAALQSVDHELYDAVRVDGGGSWVKFWHVTLPSIRPVFLVLLLAGTVQAFQLFELPYVLYSGPGPGSRALTIVMYLYATGFEAGDLHYASAVGWAIVVLLGLFTAALLAAYRYSDKPTPVGRVNA